MRTIETVSHECTGVVDEIHQLLCSKSKSELGGMLVLASLAQDVASTKPTLCRLFSTVPLAVTLFVHVLYLR